MSRKINNLLRNWPANAVANQRWLNSQGVDRRLADSPTRRLADKYVRTLLVHARQEFKTERVEIFVESKDLIDSLAKHYGTAKCVVKA